MRRLLSSALLLALIGGCNDAEQDGAATTQHAKPIVQALPSKTTLPPPTLAVSDQPVVLLISDSYSGNPQAVRDQVNLAVWHDGRIVWRSPKGELLQARIDPAKLQRLLDRLHEEGVFGEGKADYGNLGPGASFEIIEVRTHDRELVMRSWHELYGDGKGSLATANGIESLDGRDPAVVMAQQPEEYKRFLRIWYEIRSTAESWVPVDGEPFTGVIER